MKIPFGKAAAHLSKAAGGIGTIASGIGPAAGKGMTWAVDHPKTVMAAAALAPTLPLVQSGMSAALQSTPVQMTMDAMSGSVQEAFLSANARQNVDTLRQRDMSRYTSPSGNIVFGLHNLRR